MIVNQDGAAYPSHSQLPRMHTRVARRGRLDRWRQVCSRSTQFGIRVTMAETSRWPAAVTTLATTVVAAAHALHRGRRPGASHALSRTFLGLGRNTPHATMIKESIGPTMQTASKAVNTYGLADAVHSSFSDSTLW